MLTMWLRTYICVVTITIEALIHICMNHTKTQKLLPINFWGPQIYYCCLGAKRNMFQGFVWWAKNTARGVRFLLRFNMYLFLAQCEQVYLCLARALNNMSYVHVLRKIRTTDNPSSCLSSPNCAINI